MTTIQTTINTKTYFAIGSAPFTDYRDKLPGTEVIYDIEQARMNPTKVEIQLAHASRGTTHAVVHISALDQGPARELAEKEAAEETEQAEQVATASTVQKIAETYMASAEAGERFEKNLNTHDKEQNADLFIEADRMFCNLIGDHETQLLALRYAVAQGNFASAKAYYAEITK